MADTAHLGWLHCLIGKPETGWYTISHMWKNLSNRRNFDCHESLLNFLRTLASDSYDDSEVEDNCDLKEVNVFDEHEPFVWGLGCRDNRSLNFYVLDFVTQWSLVQKLDLDSLDKGRNGSSGYRVFFNQHLELPEALKICWGKL